MQVTHILIFGDVQGVGYRKFVKHFAKKFGLIGWVRNLPEGSVEAEIAGEEKAVAKLIGLCHKGPFLAKVKSVEVTQEEKEVMYTEFVVLRQ